MPAVAEERTIQLGMQHRMARVVPGSLDREKRTVEVTWTTGAVVERMDFWTGRRWREHLSLDPKHVRMDRLSSGRAAVLDNHGGWRGVHGESSQGRIGTVDTGDLGDPPKATLRFSRRPGVNAILDDIEDRVLTDVSVGYRIHALQDITEDKSEEVRDMLAVDWEPYEISIVDIGADSGAHVRSEPTPGEQTYSVRVLTRHSEEPVAMPQETKEGQAPGAKPDEQRAAPPATPEPHAPTVDVTKERKEAQRALLERNSKISKLVRSFGLGQEVEDELCRDADLSLEQAMDRISEQVEKRQDGGLGTAAPSGNPGHFQGGEAELEKFQRGLERAMAERLGPVSMPGKERQYAVDDCPEANGLRGHSIQRKAEEFLRRTGKIRPGEMLSPRGIFKRAFHETSDFPLLTEGLLNKQLEASMGLYPGTWEQFSRARTANDFKELYSYHVGEPFTMELIEEGGEYTAGSVGERRANFRVRKYGRQIRFTWEMFKNDDLDALGQIVTGFGFESTDLKNRLAWGLINDNVVLSDGSALFNSTAQNGAGGHDNIVGDIALTTGGAIDEDAYDGAWLKFRDRKGINSAAEPNETQRRVNVQPIAIVTPPQLRKAHMKGLGIYTPQTADNVRVFTESDFRIVEELLLQDVPTEGVKQWYMVGRGPGVTPFEHANLAGEGLAIEREEKFDIDAVAWKGRVVHGVHVPSYHCWVRTAIP